MITSVDETIAALKLLQHAVTAEPLLALDTETYASGLPAPPALVAEDLAFTDPYTNKVRLVQLQGRYTEPFLFDLKQMPAEAVEQLAAFLNQDSVTWVAHNAKFDYKMLKVNLGVELKQVYDTMTAGYLMGYATGMSARKAGGLGLKDLARDLLGVTDIDKTEQQSYWGGELTASQIDYAAKDVAYLIPLYDLFVQVFDEEYQCSKAVDLEMRAMPAVAQMELNGIALDVAMYRLVQRCAKSSLPRLVKEICQHFGIKMQRVFLEDNRLGLKPAAFNIDSQQQMLDLLRKHGIAIENLQAETLEVAKDRYPILQTYLDYKTLNKQLSVDYEGYLHPLTKRIHPSFNQNGAATGRFACSLPNLQQVPKLDVRIPDKILKDLEAEGGLERLSKYYDSKREGYFLNYRYCFIADPADNEAWSVASLDYSGQEIAVMISLSNDPFMIQVMNQPKEIPGVDGIMVKNLACDLHSQVASTMFKIPAEQAKDKPPKFNGKSYRDLAKAVCFGLAYGKSHTSLATEWGISEDEGKKIVDDFFKPMPKLKAWLDKQGSTGMKTRLCRFGYGRLRFLNDSRHTDKKAADRAARNTPIQGNSSLMMKEGLIKLLELEQQYPDAINLMGSVHDEAIVRVRKDCLEELIPLAEKAMVEAAALFLCDQDGNPLIKGEVGIGIGPTWTK